MARILVADDDEACREMLAALYGRTHEVVTVESTEAAWLKLQEPVHFDALVCDGFDGDGPRLLRAVRNHYPRIRTLLYSGRQALVLLEASHGGRALLKPASVEALLAAVAPAEAAA
ncbi:MAG: hypothetical protein ACE147_00785 [Candidatus Methylomirabilales bacterium]